MENLSSDSLRLVYDELANGYLEQGKKAVEEFVKTHSSVYLDQSVTANTLAIATKTSKKVVEEGLVSHFAEKKIITRQ